MIRIDTVSKTFREGLSGRRVKALDQLNLEVAPGEIFGFLGPNGAGKSTAIKILLNLIRPDQGQATAFGLPVEREEVRRDIGFLPESPYFYDHLSAEELLWFGGRSSGLPRAQIRRRSAELLDRVGLADAAKRPLRTYSKGMVQRAGLALALVHDPKLVILDEPMSGLDPIGRKMVGDLMLELNAQGKTVFFSSHILTDIERYCHRFAIIVAGRVRLVETRDNLLASGESLETIFLRQVDAAQQGVRV